jgi:hypothetical protein
MKFKFSNSWVLNLEKHVNVPIMDTSRLINVFVMSATGETYAIFLDVLELEKAVPSMESATQSPTTVTVP